MRGLPDAGPHRSRALEERRYLRLRLHGRTGSKRPGPSSLARSALARIAPRDAGAPAVLDRRLGHQGRTRLDLARSRRSFRLCADAVADLYRDLVCGVLPGAHQPGAAGGLRVRRRSQAQGLCPCDRGWRLAGLDRLPGARPAGTRDHASVGAALLFFSAFLRHLGPALPPQGPARRHPGRPRRYRAQRRTRGRLAAGLLRHALRQLRPAAQHRVGLVRRFHLPAIRAERNDRGDRAHGAAGGTARPLALEDRSARHQRVEVARIRPAQPGEAAAVVYLAGVAARGLDPVALASPAGRSACRRALAVRAGAARRHLDDRLLRAVAAARPARTGHPGGIRPSHLPAKRISADRLVHPAFLQRLGGHHLGLLDRDADRLPAEDGRQRDAAGAGLHTFGFMACVGVRTGGHARVVLAGALAHRSTSCGPLEDPGAARRGCGAVLAAGHDLVVAGTRLRAQLRAAGSRHRATRRATELHLHRCPDSAPDRRAAVSRPVQPEAVGRQRPALPLDRCRPGRHRQPPPDRQPGGLALRRHAAATHERERRPAALPKGRTQRWLAAANEG
ncbi:hypothetical protein VARIO8X_90489 [Burkholderiales bacterium 8X]|nr:hypothetical protein VARIO8X_90489 [Burkholderiales bacterium 8X]